MHQQAQQRQSDLGFFYHELLTLLEPPQEGRQCANVHGVGEDGHEVVKDTGDLSKQGTDPLGSVGDLDVEQLLNGKRETLLVGHHGDVVETVEVWKSLPHSSLMPSAPNKGAALCIPEGMSCTQSTSPFLGVAVRRGDHSAKSPLR